MIRNDINSILLFPMILLLIIYKIFLNIVFLHKQLLFNELLFIKAVHVDEEANMMKIRQSSTYHKFKSNMRFKNFLKICEIKIEVNKLGNHRDIAQLKCTSPNVKEILPEIKYLVSLDTLILENTQISCLPNEIVNCEILTSLTLRNNKFKVLPLNIFLIDFLADLTIEEPNLTSFIIPDDVTFEFSGRIRITNTEIKILELQNTKIFSLILNNNSLEKLCESCYNNIFIGIGKLSTLVTLEIHNNKLKNIPQELQKLNLKTLDLSFNNIKTIPIFINDMITLTKLCLSNNSFEEFPVLLDLSIIKEVYLANNQISGKAYCYSIPLKTNLLDLSNNLIDTLVILGNEVSNIELVLIHNKIENIEYYLDFEKFRLQVKDNKIKDIPNKKQMNRNNNISSIKIVASVYLTFDIESFDLFYDNILLLYSPNKGHSITLAKQKDSTVNVEDYLEKISMVNCDYLILVNVGLKKFPLILFKNNCLEWIDLENNNIEKIPSINIPSPKYQSCLSIKSNPVTLEDIMRLLTCLNLKDLHFSYTGSEADIKPPKGFKLRKESDVHYVFHK